MFMLKSSLSDRLLLLMVEEDFYSMSGISDNLSSKL